MSCLRLLFLEVAREKIRTVSFYDFGSELNRFVLEFCPKSEPFRFRFGEHFVLRIIIQYFLNPICSLGRNEVVSWENS